VHPEPHRTNGQLDDQCPPTPAIMGLCRGSACKTKAEILCNLPILRSRRLSLGQRFYRAGAVQRTRKLIDFISRSNRVTKRQPFCAQRGNSFGPSEPGREMEAIGPRHVDGVSPCGLLSCDHLG
jgi:hypothetical protein